MQAPRAKPSRPRPRPARPRIAAMAGAALAAALALAATGCASFDAAFGQREAVVQFTPQTTNATRLQVRAACSRIPNAVPERLPTDHLASDILNDVRYQVGKASDADLAMLDQCLQKFPSVVGVTVSSPSGM